MKYVFFQIPRVLVAIFFVFSGLINTSWANTLDCTVNPMCFNYSYSFNENSTVTGMVSFLAGIRINNNATVGVNIDKPIRGQIDLNGGTLQLNGNLTVQGGYNSFTSGTIECSGKLLTIQNGFILDNGASLRIKCGSDWADINCCGNQVGFTGKVGGGWSHATGLVVDSKFPGGDWSYYGVRLANAKIVPAGDFTDGGVQTPVFRCLQNICSGVAFINCDIWLDNNMTQTIGDRWEPVQTVSINSNDGKPYSLILGAGQNLLPVDATQFIINNNITLDVYHGNAVYLPQKLTYIFNNGSSFRASEDFNFLYSRIQINGVVNFYSNGGKTVTFGNSVESYDANIQISPGSTLCINDGLTVNYANVK